MAVYQYLLSTKIHPSAEKIYNSIKDSYPGLSLATIYKTLETFKKASLIQELSIGESRLRYDADISTHPHFYCYGCNEVYDLEANGAFSVINEKVSIPNGFEVQSSQLFLFGKCSKCTV